MTNAEWKERHHVVWAHCVGVDDLSDGDVDDGLGDGHQVGVLIHVELIFEGGNVARRQEEPPADEPRKEILNDAIEEEKKITN